MVADVLEMVAAGLAWETIIEQWHSSITKDAIAEAVRLAGQAFLEHIDEYVVETISNTSATMIRVPRNVGLPWQI